MSGTVSPDQEADQRAGEAVALEAAGVHRRGRRRWVAAAAVVVVVAGAAVAAGVSGAFGRPRPSNAGAASNADLTSTATVVRRSLSSQTLVDATLGNAGSYSVVNQVQGTITALPAVGTIVHQGQVLYQVSGSRVVLLYGKVPAWRSLSEGTTGPDVAELNTDLVALGDAASADLGPRQDWDYFSAETAYALEELQSKVGVAQTGGLALGQAVFLPAAAQITALGAATVLGGPAQPGSALLTASSTTPVVTVGVDPAQETEVKVGDQVTITLPDNQTTPGVVSSVGTVATVPSSASSSGPGSSSGSSTPTITVEVALSDPKAAAGLSQAPVEVAITTGSVSSALVVPVDALLAQAVQGDGKAGGGYAVEVTGPGGHHLVAVSPGLFDDAAGLVQVSGPGLAAGQHVVVPAT